MLDALVAVISVLYLVTRAQLVSAGVVSEENVTTVRDASVEDVTKPMSMTLKHAPTMY